jgi:thiosulfate/3-mercaptopyruvate sulfurtransferase
MVTSAEGYVHPEMLAETEWLAEHLHDPNIRIVDAESHDAYRRVHIAGAVGYRSNPFLKEQEGALHLMGPEQFAGVMAELGIGNNTLVVAYDGFSGLYAARLWWALNYYGHTQVKVLNGGWDKWLAEGRPISNATPQPPQATFTPRVQEELIARCDYVQDTIGRSERVLLDVRSDDEWTGANTRGTKRGGRIPGAVHLEWLNYVNSTTKQFKPAAELREMFQKAGVVQEKEVTLY